MTRNVITRILKGLSHPKVAISLVAVFILLLALGSSTAGDVSLEDRFGPAVYFFLKVVGLTDLYSSGWFLFVLIGLAMNQLASVFLLAPLAWKNFRNPDLELLDANSPEELREELKNSEPSFVGEVSSKVSREEFVDQVEQLPYDPFGEAYAYEEESSDQMVSQQGRWIPFSRMMISLGFLVLIAATLTSQFVGVEVEVVVGEGETVSTARLVRGDHPQAKWEAIPRGRREKGKWYQTDFEVRNVRLDVDHVDGHQIGSAVNRIEILREDEDPKPLMLGYDSDGYHQGKFEGFRVVLSEFNSTGTPVGTFLFTSEEQGNPHSVRISKFEKGQTFEFEDRSFQVLELESPTDAEKSRVGSVAKLREFFSEESGGGHFDYWTYAKYPDYLHPWLLSKGIEKSLALESVGEKYGSHIRFVKDPSTPVLWIAIAFVFLGFLVAWYNMGDRPMQIWYLWNPERVLFVAVSDDPHTQKTVFKNMFNEFERNFVLDESGSDDGEKTQESEVLQEPTQSQPPEVSP